MKFKRPSPTLRFKIAVFGHAALLIAGVAFNGHHPAQAKSPSCRNVGASSKHATLGSQVDGDLVTICLDANFRKKFLQTPKPKPHPIVHISKVPKAKPTHYARPAKSAPKPKVSTRPKTVVHPTPRATAKNLADRAVFKPKTSTILVRPSAHLKVGATAQFETSPKTILGNSKLLGRPVVVRFVPTSLSWNFGDGVVATASETKPNVSHRYSAAGTYSVTLSTTFTVGYRLASGRWFNDPDSISLASTPMQVQVGGSSAKTHLKVVLLTSR